MHNTLNCLVSTLLKCKEFHQWERLLEGLEKLYIWAVENGYSHLGLILKDEIANTNLMLDANVRSKIETNVKQWVINYEFHSDSDGMMLRRSLGW